jgi:hypothetical protein
MTLKYTNKVERLCDGVGLSETSESYQITCLHIAEDSQEQAWRDSGGSSLRLQVKGQAVKPFTEVNSELLATVSAILA